MEIDINQYKFALNDEYRIFVDRNESHFASSKLFSWNKNIKLFKNGIDTPKYILTETWLGDGISFDLADSDNNIYEFRTISYSDHHFICNVKQDVYEIYGHRGRKYSVFLNTKQIGWWEKEAVSWFNGDNYKIIANVDCNFELLISFCLIIDKKLSNNKGGSIGNLDFGNFGINFKEFDSTWQPKR